MLPITLQVFEKTKQIIIVNGARKPSKEKLLAQITQASAGAFDQADQDSRTMWLMGGRPKLVLKALGENDFQDLLLQAEQRNLPVCRVSETDQITCLGIGPASAAQIDQLTMVLDFYNWFRENVAGNRL